MFCFVNVVILRFSQIPTQVQDHCQIPKTLIIITIHKSRDLLSQSNMIFINAFIKNIFVSKFCILIPEKSMDLVSVSRLVRLRRRMILLMEVKMRTLHNYLQIKSYQNSLYLRNEINHVT